MNVIAHHERCVGNGICEGILPAVFEVGDDGLVIVHNENIGNGDGDSLRNAMNSCPTKALRLLDMG